MKRIRAKKIVRPPEKPEPTIEEQIIDEPPVEYIVVN
jgi:hypothetical protein